MAAAARKSFTKALGDLITYLQSVQTDSEKLDSVADDLAAAEVKLDATKSELETAETNLRSRAGLVDQARKQASTDMDKEILDKSNQLRTLNDQIKSKTSELAEVNVNVKNALAQHQTILDSLDSLRKKLA
jgi:chromosome segregation ATPase